MEVDPLQPNVTPPQHWFSRKSVCFVLGGVSACPQVVQSPCYHSTKSPVFHNMPECRSSFIPKTFILYVDLCGPYHAYHFFPVDRAAGAGALNSTSSLPNGAMGPPTERKDSDTEKTWLGEIEALKNNIIAMASTLEAMASNLPEAIASNLTIEPFCLTISKYLGQNRFQDVK